MSAVEEINKLKNQKKDHQKNRNRSIELGFLSFAFISLAALGVFTGSIVVPLVAVNTVAIGFNAVMTYIDQKKINKLEKLIEAEENKVFESYKEHLNKNLNKNTLKQVEKESSTKHVQKEEKEDSQIITY